jgi:hypothetical protein
VQFALRRNLPAAAVVRSLVRGYITDPAGPAGLRFTDGLPEPNPADNKAIVEVKAFAINHDEANLIARRPNGWRPGQDVAGVVIKAAASGAGPAAVSGLINEYRRATTAET